MPWQRPRRWRQSAMPCTRRYCLLLTRPSQPHLLPSSFFISSRSAGLSQAQSLRLQAELQDARRTFDALQEKTHAAENAAIRAKGESDLKQHELQSKLDAEANRCRLHLFPPSSSPHSPVVLHAPTPTLLPLLPCGAPCPTGLLTASLQAERGETQRLRAELAAATATHRTQLAAAEQTAQIAERLAAERVRDSCLCPCP
jgi:hypothetical protein